MNTNTTLVEAYKIVSKPVDTPPKYEWFYTKYSKKFNVIIKGIDGYVYNRMLKMVKELIKEDKEQVEEIKKYFKG